MSSAYPWPIGKGIEMKHWTPEDHILYIRLLKLFEVTNVVTSWKWARHIVNVNKTARRTYD